MGLSGKSRPRPSGGGSSPWPDGSPARRAASHCICHSAGLGKPSSIVPWPDCAPCHSLPDGGGGNRPPSGQPNVPANSRQSGLRVPLAVSSPRYLALTNIRRRSQSLPAATEDKHRPPSTPNRARTIALPCPYRPFRCCIVIPSVDLGLRGPCARFCSIRTNTESEHHIRRLGYARYLYVMPVVADATMCVSKRLASPRGSQVRIGHAVPSIEA